MSTLNIDTLANFQEFMQPDELLDFLARVQQELRSAWPPLESMWLSQDWAGVQKGAHRLKSVVGSVGCEGLYQALNQLENSLRAQPAHLPSVDDLRHLQAEVASADQALQHFLCSP